jgi:hypothetical protein
MASRNAESRTSITDAATCDQGEIFILIAENKGVSFLPDIPHSSNDDSGFFKVMAIKAE